MVDFRAIWQNIRRGNTKPFLLKLFRPIFDIIGHKGFDIHSEDWDNLIILDACRYDVFEDINWLEGKLEHRSSKGASSSEWLEQNFPEEEYEDIVYISANPHLCPFDLDFIDDAMDSDKFHDFKPVYLEEIPEEGVKSANYMSIHPRTVNRFAKEFADKYPSKKLVIHYMQPHLPYIGDTKIRLGEEVETPFDLFSHPDCKRGYKDNLRLVLEHVESLLPHLDGKTVISADHGELFGEWGLHGHPTGIYFADLVKVPWFIVESDSEEELSSVDF